MSSAANLSSVSRSSASPCQMPSSPVSADAEREIRFAVVMYGGVSLAIYINGVTQELLNLASATAENPSRGGQFLFDQPNGTVEIYRMLGQLLSMSERDRQQLESQLARSGDLSLDAASLPSRITVKFVIDTISGTSAGGINGIFLGKALANGQSLDQLRQMWIEEGDILKLINDKHSIRDLGAFPSPDPPNSLLNGQRMYRRLVEALDGMDVSKPSAAGARSGYVDELDVFATATDVNGLPVFLKLADGVVTERRYKNVFQFSYREVDGRGKSDFGCANNPFLAYAARCTSSFPVAFPPMQLESIGEVLVTTAGRLGQQGLGRDVDRWRRYFPNYQPSADIPVEQQNPAWYQFEKRPFCDGGYLDNKPFSYAIDVLSKRVSRLPTDRKLIYIEPDPEHPELAKASNTPPNPMENARLSQSLATYEGIREDLERVLERNRLIERVDRILAGSDSDVKVWRGANNFNDAKLFLEGEFADLLMKYGPSYGGYHRLKVGALTDEIGEWIAAAAKFQPSSAYVNAIRLIVRAWRERHYSPPGTAKGLDTEPYFLYHFDLSYRIRRLRFVASRLDSMRRAVYQGHPLDESQGIVAAMSRRVVGRPDLVAALDALRSRLHEALSVLLRAREQLLITADGNPLRPLLAEVAPEVAVLKSILLGRTFEERFATAQEAVQRTGLLPTLNRVAEVLRGYVSDAAIKASDISRSALQTALESQADSDRDVMQQVMDFYENYQGYDFVSFPVIYATSVGEELSTVEVIRISPEDATTLVNRAAGDMRRKLAGTVLMHFGAFLEQKWRRNDMLWGRLDGAERLIKSLLPQNCPTLTSLLVKHAQLRILEEYFSPMNSKALLGYAAEVASQFGSVGSETKKLEKFVSAGAGTDGATMLSRVTAAALQQSLGAEGLLEYFKRKDGYEVSIEPTPSSSALALSRGTTVIGKMLQKIGNDGQVQPAGKLGSWVTRAGQVLFGLVEVSMPGKLLRLLGQYWLKVAYLLEAILIVGGLLFGNPGTEQLGWILLVLTLVANTLHWLLGDWFAGRTRAITIISSMAGLILVALVCIGAFTAWQWIEVHGLLNSADRR